MMIAMRECVKLIISANAVIYHYFIFIFIVYSTIYLTAITSFIADITFYLITFSFVYERKKFVLKIFFWDYPTFTVNYFGNLIPDGLYKF